MGCQAPTFANLVGKNDLGTSLDIALNFTLMPFITGIKQNLLEGTQDPLVGICNPLVGI